MSKKSISFRGNEVQPIYCLGKKRTYAFQVFPLSHADRHGCLSAGNAELPQNLAVLNDKVVHRRLHVIVRDECQLPHPRWRMKGMERLNERSDECFRHSGVLFWSVVMDACGKVQYFDLGFQNGLFGLREKLRLGRPGHLAAFD